MAAKSSVPRPDGGSARSCSLALVLCHSCVGTRLDSRESSLYKPRAFHRPPSGGRGAQVAQLVEHCTENAGVGGSIPPLGTTNCSPIVSHCRTYGLHFKALEHVRR